MTASASLAAAAPVTRKRRPGGRREVILGKAIELFVQQGYQATGIDEIGAAANISGPAIYRHFASKQHLLEAAFDRLLESARDDWDRILDTDVAPREKIRMFVEASIRTTIDDQLVFALFYREAQHLPVEKRRVIVRLNRQLTRDWARVLLEVTPALSEAEAITAVDAVTNLIHTAARSDGGLGKARLQALLTDMALGSLDAVLAPR
jgi:AcrR family transcriptional regulator